MTVALGREQAWAQLEEKEGALQRADELRNFRMQERTELVLPASFAAGFDPLQPREAPFQSIINTVRAHMPVLLHAEGACPLACAGMQAACKPLVVPFAGNVKGGRRAGWYWEFMRGLCCQETF